MEQRLLCLLPEIHNCPSELDDAQLVYWIARLTGSCVYGSYGAISWTLGSLSIVSWLFAQVPQIITNYKLQSVHGVSPAFLISWFLGDLANLAGCILTRQLAFQVLLASYFVLIDFALVCQYIYYRAINPPMVVFNVVEGQEIQHNWTPRHTTKTSISFLRAASLLAVAEARPSSLDSHFLQPMAAGRIFSWLCAFFYLSSRIPQIYKNHTRKSVHGLNIRMFIAAFCGNLFYTAGILASKQDLRVALPFLLGSGGTLLFDGVIFIQHALWAAEGIDVSPTMHSAICQYRGYSEGTVLLGHTDGVRHY